MSSLGLALEALRTDALIAYPTETVWGLGANARSALAMERLLAFKGRRDDRPVSVLVDGVEAAAALGAEFDASARRLAEAHWPGPLTLVLPCAAHAFAPGIARSDGAVGFRCSSHPVAARLAAAALRAGVGPLTSTSLNASGGTPAACLADARAICDARVLVTLGPGPDAGGGAPSSVVDCTGATPVVLREAALAAELLLCRAPSESKRSSA